jgi:hypothetical protein
MSTGWKFELKIINIWAFERAFRCIFFRFASDKKDVAAIPNA